MHIRVFQTDKTNKQTNKNICLDQSSEFYNISFKKWLKHIKMYSTCNDKKLVVAEEFIRTLKNKISKHKTAVSKNVYFGVSDDIVDNYNSPYY